MLKTILTEKLKPSQLLKKRRNKKPYEIGHTVCKVVAHGYLYALALSVKKLLGNINKLPQAELFQRLASHRSILLEVAPVLFCKVFSMVWE